MVLCICSRHTRPTGLGFLPNMVVFLPDRYPGRLLRESYRLRDFPVYRIGKSEKPAMG